MNNIKGAIFDLDGTLFDSLWAWEEIDKRFLSKRGHDVPPDYSKAISALSYRDSAVYTIKRFNLSDTPDALMKEWMDMSREMYAIEIKLKKDAKQFLLALKSKGIRLAVATSSTRELYEPALKNNGIYELFDVVVDTTGIRGKDFPDVYLAAAIKMGLGPGESVVFEDLPVAISIAKSAGFRTVGIVDKHFSPAMKESADFIAKDYSELIKLMNKAKQ